MDKLKAIDLTKPPSLAIKAIQIVIGIIVVYVIYLLCTIAVKADKLAIDLEKDISKKRKTDVINGYIDSNNSIAVNTIIQFATNYLPITPSMNVKGGAQFSYKLWLYIEDASAIGDKMIFIKGDPKMYTYKIQEQKYNISTKSMEPLYTRKAISQIAKCPLLSFKSGGDSGSVEFNLKFNTLHNLDETFTVENIKSEKSIYRNNLISIFSKQWFMITIVFQDNMPINDFESGIIVKFYLNDVMYTQKVYNSALKQNDSDLVLFPELIQGCKMTDFSYYNYAIGDEEVNNSYKKGPTLTASTTFGSVNNSVSQMSDNNRMDIWNA